MGRLTVNLSHLSVTPHSFGSTIKQEEQPVNDLAELQHEEAVSKVLDPHLRPPYGKVIIRFSNLAIDSPILFEDFLYFQKSLTECADRLVEQINKKVRVGNEPNWKAEVTRSFS